MNVSFRESFLTDLRALRGGSARKRIQEVIEQVERAEDLRTIKHLKKLRGGSNFCRIRVGNYRIGIVVEGKNVIFVRCLDRKDLYRFFP